MRRALLAGLREYATALKLRTPCARGAYMPTPAPARCACAVTGRVAAGAGGGRRTGSCGGQGEVLGCSERRRAHSCARSALHGGGQAPGHGVGVRARGRTWGCVGARGWGAWAVGPRQRGSCGRLFAARPRATVRRAQQTRARPRQAQGGGLRVEWRMLARGVRPQNQRIATRRHTFAGTRGPWTGRRLEGRRLMLTCC